MNVLISTQAAYLAGLVDGEGYIGLLPQRKHREDWLAPKLAIGNTDRPMIEWLERTTGIGYEYNTRHDNHWKDQIWWVVPTDEVVAFLNAVRPYLVTKRLQAELLLEYFEKCYLPRGRYLTDENRRLRKVIYTHLKLLNRRGKDARRTGSEAGLETPDLFGDEAR